MTKPGRRRLEALLLIFLVIAGAVAIFGPGLAQGQSKIVFGYVSEEGSNPPRYLGGVRVSLVDANINGEGFRPTLETNTSGDGLFQFTPPTGTYLLRFTKAEYFDNETATPFRFDGSQNLRMDASVEKMPARTISFQVHVQDSGSAPIAGAAVALYEPAHAQVVASNTTNSGGDTVLRIWAATLRLQVSKDTYQPSDTAVDTSTGSGTVTMLNGVTVVGHAIAADTGLPITKGVVAFLYNIASVPTHLKILAANVTGSLYRFDAIPGTYRLIVDADNFTASVTTVTITGPTGPVDRVLSSSPHEIVKASFLLGQTDWNALAVYRNLTWNADSSIPGLNIPFIRSVALQVDHTFGNQNGVLDTPEWDAFVAWLGDRATYYVTMDRVFDVEGRTYNSTSSSPPTAVLNGPTLWINTSASYAVRGTPIPNGGTSYVVTLNMTGDTTGTVYRNQIYVVRLPREYELVTYQTSGIVTVTGWTEVTIDPGVSSRPTIKMTIRKSSGGVARAQVIGPAGKFFVLNSTQDNYTAIVSSETNLTFSAAQSTDPVGDINDANFTWRFDNVSNRDNASWTRYNIETTFNYSVGGLFEVNLTVVEAGGNMTFRDFTLYVDDTDPVAQIRTNRTSGNANGTTLRLPEDVEVRFDGGFSSDVIFAGSDIPGRIFDGVSTPQSGYSWDFDGDGVADSFLKAPRFTWEKPGNYTLNLTVTDSVGHKSVNATITAIVNDTTKPVPNYEILDPSDDWRTPPVSMVEGKAYFFNASETTDNYDNVTALNFTWTVPGPAKVAPYGNANLSTTVARGTNGTFYGLNLSVEWTEFNQSYKLKLNVTDTGFGWNDSAKRNFAVVDITVTVTADFTKRPNLEIVPNSIKVNPSSPEEGQAINVTVQVRNQANRGNASSVIGRLSQTEPAPRVLMSGSPQWFDDRWAPLGSSVDIGPGKSVFAVFTISFAVQGSKNIQVQVNDTKEPFTVVDGSNRASATIVVRQAGWVLPVVVGGAIAALVAIGALLRIRSKIRAGEITLRRKPKEKKELEAKGAEEAEEEEEEKPREKRRL